MGKRKKNKRGSRTRRTRIASTKTLGDVTRTLSMTESLIHSTVTLPDAAIGRPTPNLTATQVRVAQQLLQMKMDQLLYETLLFGRPKMPSIYDNPNIDWTIIPREFVEVYGNRIAREYAR